MRAITPEEPIRTIPKPDGEWGRSPNSKRGGYSLEDESLLEGKQLGQLRVSYQLLALPTADTAQVDCQTVCIQIYGRYGPTHQKHGRILESPLPKGTSLFLRVTTIA
jgi:hypothetical protein